MMGSKGWLWVAGAEVIERVESLVRRILRRLASMGLRKYNDIAVVISEWRIPRRREGLGEIDSW